MGVAEPGVRVHSTGAKRSTDADGTRYDLISPIALEEIAKAYAEGAIKYGDHNWLNGFAVHDLLNHAIRHVYLFLSGDRSEPHLPHAAWGLMAAIHSHKQWPHLNEGHLLSAGCVPPKSVTTPAPVPTEPELASLARNVETVESIEPDGFASAFDAFRRNSESSDGILAEMLMSIDLDDIAAHAQASPGTAAEIASRRPRPVLYLSGPMSGIPDYNFPAFRAAARKLRDKGYPVIDPSDFGAAPSISWAACLQRDIGVMGHADVIVTLPGWELSRGASLETDVARRLGKALVSYGDIAERN